MAKNETVQLAQIMTKNGERVKIDDSSSVYYLSELSLTTRKKDGRVYPDSLTAPMVGVIFHYSVDDDVWSIVEDDVTDEGEVSTEQFVVEDEKLLEHIGSFMKWRAGIASDFNL